MFLGGALYGVGSARAKSKMNSGAASTEVQYRHLNTKRKGNGGGLVASYFNSSSSAPTRESSPTSRRRKVKV